MKITTNTNTGSLADLLEGEALIFQQNWDVILDGEAPNPVEITKIVNENGTLKLEWEKYTRINFEKYILYRKFGKINDSAEFRVLATYTDPNQLSFFDHSYIGGNATYWVVVKGSDQTSLHTKKEINYPLPAPAVSWVEGDSARFVWRKNAFYNAVKKVELSFAEPYPVSNTVVFSTENMNDTTVVIDQIRFGNYEKYTLSTHPKSDIELNGNAQILKSDVTLAIGENLPKAKNWLGSPTENYMYLWDGVSISKLDMGSKKVVSTVSAGYFYDWFISAYDGNLYTHNPNLTRYNKNNLNDYKVFNPADFNIHGFWTTTTISSSNRIAGPIGSYIGVYDISANRLVFTEKNTNIGWCDFSPDGNYAIKTNYPGYADQVSISVYGVTETGLNKIGELPKSNYTRKIWIPESDHQLLLLDGYEYDIAGKPTESTVKIVDVATVKIEREFQVKVGYLTNLDNHTRQIAFWDEIPFSDNKRSLNIYNYESGELVKEINLSPRIDQFYIFRSQVCSSEGFCLDYSNL